jgi:hypothetical protein
MKLQISSVKRRISSLKHEEASVKHRVSYMKCLGANMKRRISSVKILSASLKLRISSIKILLSNSKKIGHQSQVAGHQSQVASRKSPASQVYFNLCKSASKTVRLQAGDIQFLCGEDFIGSIYRRSHRGGFELFRLVLG